MVNQGSTTIVMTDTANPDYVGSQESWAVQVCGPALQTGQLLTPNALVVMAHQATRCLGMPAPDAWAPETLVLALLVLECAGTDHAWHIAGGTCCTCFLFTWSCCTGQLRSPRMMPLRQVSPVDPATNQPAFINPALGNKSATIGSFINAAVTITALGPDHTPVPMTPKTVYLDESGYANVAFTPVSASNITYMASYPGDAAWLPSSGRLSELGATHRASARSLLHARTCRECTASSRLAGRCGAPCTWSAEKRPC